MKTYAQIVTILSGFFLGTLFYHRGFDFYSIASAILMILYSIYIAYSQNHSSPFDESKLKEYAGKHLLVLASNPVSDHKENKKHITLFQQETWRDPFSPNKSDHDKIKKFIYCYTSYSFNVGDVVEIKLDYSGEARLKYSGPGYLKEILIQQPLF